MNIAPPFQTEKSAAPSLRALVEYLKSNHEHTHLYRGQVREYDSLIPSGHRRLVTGRKGPLHVLGVQQSASAREMIRGKERNRIVRNWGKNIGSIIAQQYGLSSISLDLTEDPDVAAFFATHNWPRYDQSPTEGIGIIYRFDSVRFADNLIGTDFISSWAGKDVDNKPHWFIGFAPEFSLPANYVSPPSREEILFTHPMIVSHNLLQELWTQHMADDERRNIELSNTRLTRQKASFFIPSVNWLCSTSLSQEYRYLDRIHRNVVYPGWAVGKRLLSVEDCTAYPRLNKFYFRHTSERANSLTREMLWPNRTEDRLLHLIQTMIEIEQNQYFTSNSCESDDQSFGIVDRGYYNT